MAEKIFYSAALCVFKEELPAESLLYFDQFFSDIRRMSTFLGIYSEQC